MKSNTRNKLETSFLATSAVKQILNNYTHVFALTKSVNINS